MGWFEKKDLKSDPTPKPDRNVRFIRISSLGSFFAILMITLTVMLCLALVVSSIYLLQFEEMVFMTVSPEQWSSDSTTLLYFFQRLIPLFFLLAAILTAIASIFFNRLFKPVSHLVRTMQSWVDRKYDVQLPFNAPFEFGVLAQSMQMIKEDFQTQIDLLEAEKIERVQKIDQLTEKLCTVAEVASDVNSIRNLHIFLDGACSLLMDRLKLYHVVVFLIDPQREYLILEAAPGEAGSAMIAQGHRLPLGGASIVGYVASNGESRIVMDGLKEPVFIKNPLLPRARSEIALPLAAANNILGVLDIHQDFPSAFGLQDKVFLQGVADQIASAVEKTRIQQQYFDAKDQLNKLRNQIKLDVWQTIAETSPIAGYEIDSKGIRSFGWDEPVRDLGSSIRTPILVRGDITAWLDVFPAGKHLSVGETELLKILSERIGQAIESARIFDETMKRASREQAVNEIMTSLSGTLDLDRLLQEAVRQIGQLPNVSSVSIRIDDSNSGNELGE